MVTSNSLSRQAPDDTGPSEAAALAHVHAVVARSGSSFTMGMRALPPRRRDAMFAIYSFCREVDDVADEPGRIEDKRAALAEWRREVERIYQGSPRTPTGRALERPAAEFELPKAEFLAVIDGMEMDVDDSIQAPSMELYWRYCRRVAGAVGLLSIRVFGARGPAAEQFAITLGEALQTTNVLRDLAEDAERGRLYVPRDLLAREGLDETAPQDLLDDPRLVPVCAALAKLAHERFARVRELLELCDRRTLRPAILMLEVYTRLLDRLERRGWDRPREPVSLGKAAKLWVALRYGLMP